jgi:hypothetical protein
MTEYSNIIILPDHIFVLEDEDTKLVIKAKKVVGKVDDWDRLTVDMYERAHDIDGTPYWRERGNENDFSKLLALVELVLKDPPKGMIEVPISR